MASVPITTPQAAPLRAILYDRVSTVLQAKAGGSGGADGFQVKDCRARADSEGYAVVDTISDVDSGAAWEIEGILDVLDRAKRREFDVLIVANSGRFARNLAKRLVYERELRKNGVTVIFLNIQADDSPTGRAMANMVGVFDEYEREVISLRTMKGRRHKAERGQVVGGGPAPYGYRYVSEWVDARNRAVPIGLEPDAEAAAIVERIFHDIFERSASDLSAVLTAEGIATPATWTPSEKRPRPIRWAMTTIRRIVHNTVYRGQWMFGDIAVPVPPIVSEAIWQQAQDRLTERRKVRRGRDTERSARWTLRGALTCGHCGGALSTSSVAITGSGADAWPDRRLRRYVCARSIPFDARRNGWEPCHLPGLLAADDRTIKDGPRRYPLAGMEDLAWDAIVELFGQPGLFEAKLAMLGERTAGARSSWDDRLENIDEEIRDQERRIRRAGEEKLKLEQDDPRYTMYDEAEERATSTLGRLRAERKRYVEAGAPGLSDETKAALVRDVEAVRAILGAAIGATAKHAPIVLRREVFARLRLRGIVREDAAGLRVGRSAMVSVEWSTALGSGQGLKKLCLLQSSNGVVLTALE